MHLYNNLINPRLGMVGWYQRELNELKPTLFNLNYSKE